MAMIETGLASDEAPSRVGRPRSERSRAAVLRAAAELMHEVGLRAMTTEQIAGRSGASKATIYKWWPNKYAVAVEAFLSELRIESADPDTGSAAEDFRVMLRGLAHFYASATGRVFAQLIGEAQFDPAVATELQDRLIHSRRHVIQAIWDRGVARGELRSDVARDVAIDIVFGPAMYRLMTGYAPFDEAAADAVIDTVMRGLSV
jgi:AcrR family transcriptional regulator